MNRKIADLFGVTVDFLLGRSPLPAIDELEALDALKGLFKIIMDANGKTGAILLNEHFAQYLVDLNKAECASREIQCSDELYEDMMGSVKNKHNSKLIGANMMEQPIQIHAIYSPIYFENYRDWLRSMHYSR